ncbi:MAG: hypothetical protein ACFFDH_20730 [Promethearchaeota archaeon]
MEIFKRILFLIVGTVLVVLGGLGIFGVIGLSDEYSSQPFYLLVQLVLPIALLIIGIYLLAQFYKKPSFKDKVKMNVQEKRKD